MPASEVEEGAGGGGAAAAGVSVAVESLPGSEVGITIDVPAARVDRAYESALQRLSQRIRIEGFRPGKAPRALVEARVGPATLREEVIDHLVPPLVAEALRERRIETVGRPRVEVRELERGRPAQLVARVAVWPEVTLPDLDALRVEKAVTMVDDEMVESRLTELRERLAEIEPVEREARVGDIVVGDLAVTTGGEEVPGESRPAMEFDVREGVLVPELLAVLPGRSAGEVAEAEVTMDADHPNPALRGRIARLEVTLQAVKERRVPELTDDVAVQLSDGKQTTVDGLRAAVRVDLEKRAAAVDELNYEQRVVQEVVERSTVEIPTALVEREVERRHEDLERRLAERGLRMDRYLQYRNQSMEEWHLEQAPDARDRVKVDLVLEAASNHLGIAPTGEELAAYIRAEAADDPTLANDPAATDALLADQFAREYFSHRLKRLDLLKLLAATAAGEASPAPAPGAAAAGAGEVVEPAAGPAGEVGGGDDG